MQIAHSTEPVFLPMDEDLVRKVAGKGNSNLRKIQIETGAFVDECRHCSAHSIFLLCQRQQFE